MAVKQGRGQTTKIGKRGKDSTLKTGHRGARKTPMSRRDLIMLGKGPMQNIKVQHPGWQGVTVISQPYDPVQARINRELGLC